MTGASSGIGAPTVQTRCAAGWTVTAVTRRAVRLEDLALETGCQVVVVDVTDQQSVATLGSSTPVDLVVNNAGLGRPPGAIWEATDDEMFYDVALDDPAAAAEARNTGITEVATADVANDVLHAVSAPWRVNVGTIEIRPTEQTNGSGQFSQLLSLQDAALAFAPVPISKLAFVELARRQAGQFRIEVD